MPLLFSYNVSGASPQISNRIQSIFERLGWQNVGGSSYRYPKLGSDPAVPEDWFNRVVPALMAFRAFVLAQGLQVERFSLDAQSSTGANTAENVGATIAAADADDFEDGAQDAFGAAQLEAWINGTTTSMPYQAPPP